MKALPDQIGRFVPAPFVPLGTDGYGLSDTREALRRYFEIDAEHIAVAVLHGLVQTGALEPDDVAKAIARGGIDADVPSPVLRPAPSGE